MPKSIIYASTSDIYDSLIKRGAFVDVGSPKYALSVAPKKYDETTYSFSPEIEAVLKANQLARAGKMSEAKALIEEQKKNVLNNSLKGHLAVQAMLGPQPAIRQELPPEENLDSLEAMSNQRTLGNSGLLTPNSQFVEE